MKKVILNDKMYNLITEEEYLNNKEYYDSVNSTAVEFQYGDELIGLPIAQSKNPVGIFSNGPLVHYNLPEDISKYLCNEENNFIDFSEVSNMSEYYDKYIRYTDAEREIITNNVNQSKPTIRESDSPLLKITKQTICDKNIDMDKYSDRFENYNNDKRLLSSSNNDITIKKSNAMLENLDVDTYIITTNRDSNVPNPMSKPLVRKISGNGEELTIDEMINILKGDE